MHEQHEREQYFFAPPTLAHLARFVRRFERPLAVCCPMLAAHMWDVDGDILPVLDLDDRFARLPGFLHWDLYKPQALGASFRGAEYGPGGLLASEVGVSIRTKAQAPFQPGLIIIDPPFNIVRFDQLFAAVRILANDDFTTPLLITSTPRRGPDLTGTFARFGLVATGYKPSFVTVSDEIGIEFFGNLDDERLLPLLEAG